MKRLSLIITLTAILFLSAIQAFGVNEEILTSGGYEYVILEDRTAEIRKYNGSDTDIIIPSELNGVKVTVIGVEAFSRISAENIVIPEGVTEIKQGAFQYCEYLEKISLPKSLKTLSSSVFSNCIALKEIELPSALEVMYEYVFSYSGLEKVNYPASIKKYNEYAFAMAYELKEIAFEEGVTDIPSFMFWRCKSIEEIMLPNSLISIGEGAFYECSSLKRITAGKNVKEIGRFAFSGCFEFEAVKYMGTQEEWNDISINYETNLKRAKVHIINEHKTELHKATQSSCGVNGYTQGVYCTVCECYIEGHKALPLKTYHNYMVKYDAATTKKDGSLYSECSICGKKNPAESIAKIESIELSQTEYIYDGTEKWPELTIKNSNRDVITQIDYDFPLSVEGYDIKKYNYHLNYEGAYLRYEETSDLPGRYTIRIDFKNGYSGTEKVDFTIAPASPKPTATQTENSITLSWKKAVGATGYRVYSYNPTTKKYTKIASIKDTTYTVKNLNSGTKYYYAVKAYTKDDGTIWGDMSEVLTTATKPAKSTLTVKSASKGKATLSWTNVSGETGFQVYYKDSKDGTYKRYKTYSGNTVKATASSLTSGKTYYFKVRAYKKADGKTIYGSFSSAKSVKIK